MYPCIYLILRDMFLINVIFDFYSFSLPGGGVGALCEFSWPGSQREPFERLAYLIGALRFMNFWRSKTWSFPYNPYTWKSHILKESFMVKILRKSVLSV